jgi:hypothetical protein
MIRSILYRCSLRVFKRTPPYLNSFCASEEDLESVKFVTGYALEGNKANYSQVPVAVNNGEYSLAFSAWPSSIRQRYLAAIHNGAVVGNECIVLPDGRYLLEPVWHQSILRSHPAYNYALYTKKIRRLQGSFFLIPLYWFANYYHWNAQVLPRLYRVVNDLPIDCMFIVPDTIRYWQTQSLELLGISPNRLIKKPEREKWILETLYFSPPCAPSASHTAESVSWVRDTLLSRVQLLANHNSPRFIYVTRGRSKRRIINEESLLSELQSLGFHIVDCEKLSYLDQIIAFANCRVLCAPHGAGLVNMLWAKPGCHVLEILNQNLLDRGCFWDLSQNLGHSYSCFLGDATDAVTSGDADYLVCKHSFARVLRSVVEASR